MWYNEHTNIVLPGQCCKHSQAWKHLDWRCLMTTVSPRSQKGKLYTIYTLIDPRDQTVRYVGITYDVYQRMRQHSRQEGNNKGKKARVRGFEELQNIFIMHSLEQVRTIEEALEREIYWIQHYLQQGAHLTNIAGMSGRDLGKAPKSGEKKIITPGEAAQLFFRTATGEIVSVPDSSWGDFDVFVKRYITVTSEEGQEGVWDKANKRYVLSYMLRHGISLALYDVHGNLLNVTWANFISDSSNPASQAG